MDPLDRARLSWEEITLVRRRGGARRWTRGEVLMREGQACGGVVLVESGLVKVGVVSVDGHESLLALRGAGELLGEVSLLDGGRRAATVSALTPVRGVLVAEAAFRALLAESSSFEATVQRIVIDRWRQSDRLRAGQGAHRGAAWIACVLLELCRGIGTRAPAGFPTGIGVRVSQEVLAKAANVSTDSVGRAFRVLSDAQLIAPQYGQVVVVDPRRLESWLRSST
ncbi:Crp/Fnr family transcriptional regulator [Streptomyces sp. 4N509B]|uniref:Crp/Fnr family transcriptional regulator n=1 Tax=Streptomyces sp. 4N509B TaxID=3457413 RepID=UPI003FD52301